MDFWRSVSGLLTVELTSADIRGAMSAIIKYNLDVRNLEITSDLSITFQIQQKYYKQLRELAEKRGETLRTIEKKGIYWQLIRFRKRPVLMIGFLIFLMFSLWIPGRIFFVQVEGNYTIPSRKIAEAAANCGICFGASGREVRSEKMKNALLQELPELAWAGVNTRGCVAVISVHEREVADVPEVPYTVSSIIADRDGIIRQISAWKGSALCKVGQAVKAGQVLISGYTDCGIHIQATQAQGEVYAETNRTLTVMTPAIYRSRGDVLDRQNRISIIFGKKRINLKNSSGILGSSCAKIYKENYITLPGGFVLPIAVAVETWEQYEIHENIWEARQDFVSQFAQTYLCKQMCAGNIEAAEQIISDLDTFLRLDGSYACVEMIGTTRIEESILNYVKND